MADYDRRWPRIDLALSATVRIEDLEEAALTLNVSREGLFVRTDRPRPVGTPVRVTVALASGELLQAEGVVVHVHPDPDGEAPAPSDRPAGMGIFLTTTTRAWRDFCDGVERTRTRPEDETPPLPPRSGRRKRST
ncbi:MAG: PilZ domain-containing protein [Deltaproteobacteria bacterium]|nr:PilZ domain-containing protein [Deltaproteobacteria bacterium]